MTHTLLGANVHLLCINIYRAPVRITGRGTRAGVSSIDQKRYRWALMLMCMRLPCVFVNNLYQQSCRCPSWPLGHSRYFAPCVLLVPFTRRSSKNLFPPSLAYLARFLSWITGHRYSAPASPSPYFPLRYSWMPPHPPPRLYWCWFRRQFSLLYLPLSFVFENFSSCLGLYRCGTLQPVINPNLCLNLRYLNFFQICQHENMNISFIN